MFQWRNLKLVRAAFPAGHAQLSALCDLQFGPGSGWAPSVDKVFVEWVQTTNTKGNTFSFLCLCVNARSRAGESVTTVVAAFTDLPWALIRGREVFGFPVLLANFTPQVSGETVVETLVANAGKAEVKEIATLAWTPGPPGVALTELLSLVQLKQARDPIDPTCACYQAPVTAAVTLSAVTPGTLGTLQLTISDYDSLGLSASLGLRPGALTAAGAAYVDASFSVTVTSPRTVAPTSRGGVPFRFRQGDPQFGPDYEFTDVDIVGFRIPVSQEALRRVCDEQLNDPYPDRGYRYVPADVALIVECLTYPNLLSQNPPPPPDIWPKAGTQQRELSFRILVGRVDEGSLIAHSPAIFCPFIYVDNPWSLISGREVIGYPKVLAQFSPVPAGAGQFETCEIEAAVEATDGCLPEPLLTVDCHSDPGSAMLDAVENAAFSWWSLADLQSGQADVESFIQPWLAGQALGYGLVQRKIFPDAADPNQACFDQLTEGDYTLRRVEASLPFAFASLQFSAADPFGICAAFGFSTHIVIPPGAWYRVKADFRVRVIDPLA